MEMQNQKENVNKLTIETVDGSFCSSAILCFRSIAVDSCAIKSGL